MASKIKFFTTAVDVVCFLLVVTGFIVAWILIYRIEPGLYPYQRAFHCEDITIQRPIVPQIVPYQVNIIFSFTIPVFVILIVELMNNLSTESGENQEAATAEDESYGPLSLKPWIASIIWLIVTLCFGAFLTENITFLTKLTVGRLRPTFMALCKANITAADCQQGYITRDVCTGNPIDVKIARMSFPSGHSSLAMYAMLFLVFYLQAAIETDTRLLKPLLQALAVSASLFIGWSRIADNSHFGTDVLAGFALGGIMAWFIVSPPLLAMFGVQSVKITEQWSELTLTFG